jgi:hypothetical protein
MNIQVAWHLLSLNLILLDYSFKLIFFFLAQTSDSMILAAQCRKIPANYKVLFLTGGGTGEFAAVPLNLLCDDKPSADFLVSGLWSKKAAQEVFPQFFDAETKYFRNDPL